MSEPEEILKFWLEEVGVEGWYKGGDALDQTIRDRFLTLWEQGKAGELKHWPISPNGVLAYLIVMDQFPRNLFREDKRAFSTDFAALEAAKCAVKKEWDLRVEEPARQFFYLPMMHSENLCDQDRSVRLIHTRILADGGSTLFHAKAHREVIRQFGRFPYRNNALSRVNTAPEAVFMSDGAYPGLMKRMRAKTSQA